MPEANPELRSVLLAAYRPCDAFAGPCSAMRWGVRPESKVGAFRRAPLALAGGGNFRPNSIFFLQIVLMWVKTKPSASCTRSRTAAVQLDFTSGTGRMSRSPSSSMGSSRFAR